MHATRTRRSRWAAIVALALTAVLSCTTASFAATEPPASLDQFCNTANTIQCNANGVDPGENSVTFNLSANTLDPAGQPKSATIADGSIQIQGQAADSSPEPLKFDPVTGKDASKSELMLLLDTSGSMQANAEHPDRFGPEIKAATSFVKQVEGLGLSIGIVTFGNKAKPELDPTPDLKQVQAVIDKIARRKPAENTDLYGAVLLGIKKMTFGSSRSILMITDGTYELKNGRPSDKVLAKTRAEVRNRLEGVEGKTENRITFRGVLVGKEPDEDIAAIGAVSRLLDNNLQQQLIGFATSASAQQAAKVAIKVQVPEAWAGQDAQLVINGRTTTGETFTTTVAFVADKPNSEAKAASPLLPVAQATSIPVGVLIGALIAVFAAMAILLTSATGALAGADNKKSAVIRRLELYTVTGGKPARVEVTEQTTRLGDSALTRSAVNLMTRFARKSRMDDALDGQLEAAGLPIRTAEWMLLHIGIAVLSAVVLYAIGGGQIAAGVVGLLLGIAGPWIFLTFARSRRESKFLAQLPDTLQLLAGSLAAGYSLPQAMDSVVRESHPPISMEFNRALVEARLGMLAEDALDGIARRTGSTDFSWIVMAIRIQRDVGGNLAELLSSVADTLRERERLRRQVDALSAEGRLSGAILGALPLVFGLYLMLTRPEYIAPLFDTKLGLLLLAVGGVMLIIGGFWMSRVIKVKV